MADLQSWQLATKVLVILVLVCIFIMWMMLKGSYAIYLEQFQEIQDLKKKLNDIERE